MVFSKEKSIPILDKIAVEVEKETINTNKMFVKSFVRIATRIRISKDDIDDLLNYYKSIGFLEQKGNTIYRLIDVTKLKKNDFINHPGRKKKLTLEEIEYIKMNYKPREFGVRKIAIVINKEREKQNLEPITFMTVHREMIKD